MGGIGDVSYVYHLRGYPEVHVSLDLIEIVPGPFPMAQRLGPARVSDEIFGLFARTYGNQVVAAELADAFKDMRKEEERRKCERLAERFERKFEALERKYNMRMDNGGCEVEILRGDEGVLRRVPETLAQLSQKG